MTDCCSDIVCRCGDAVSETIETVKHDIERFRQETMLQVRNTDIPQTGDKGVEACMATSLLALFALLFLAGARKKED